MSYKRSKRDIAQPIDDGYSNHMKNIYDTIVTHSNLLLFIYKLKIIPVNYLHILARDFEQQLFMRIRKGEDLGSQ